MFEVEEVKGSGWNVETDTAGLCSACKEWAGATYYLDENFEVEEIVSNCCSATLNYFHAGKELEEAVIESAKSFANKRS